MVDCHCHHHAPSWLCLSQLCPTSEFACHQLVSFCRAGRLWFGILLVSATVVTAQIVDNQINFEYTDGWNGKGHGTITLNGDTVHVNCVEEEHGNGRNTLNCDETLTRE